MPHCMGETVIILLCVRQHQAGLLLPFNLACMYKAYIASSDRHSSILRWNMHGGSCICWEG